MINIENGSITVCGVAGGRKTQYIADLAEKHPDKKFLYLSYGRANADAVRGRFGLNVDVHTYHSFIYHHLTKQGNNLNIVDKLSLDDVSLVNGTSDVIYVLNHFSKVAGKIGSCRTVLSTKEKRGLRIEDINSVMHSSAIYAKYCIYEGWPVTHDMYLKIGISPELSQYDYDVVVSDEHQDTTRVMQSLLANLNFLEDKAIIRIGDPRQKIFQHDGMHLDSELIGTVHQLSKSFRCGPNITKLANTVTNKHYQQYGLKPMTPADHEDEVYIYDGEENCVMEKGAILHYHNASVIAHALQLMNEGKQVKVDSPSLRKGILVYKPIIDTVRKSRIGADRELNIALRRAISSNDKERIIACRVVASQLNNLNKLESNLQELGNDNKAAKYLLGTIHYSKGMTFNCVMLGDDVGFLNINTKYHASILYTGITRASKKLYITQKLAETLGFK